MGKTILVNGKADTLKTKGILFNEVEGMIKAGENVLMLDSKGEYYESFSQEFKDNGYNVVVVNLQDPEHSHGYNPYTLPLYYYKKGATDKAFELLEKVTYEIVKDDHKGDPFWINTTSDLFTGLSLLLFREAPEDKVNIGSLNVAVDVAGISRDDKCHKYLESLEVNDPIYVCTSGTLYAPNETRESIMSVAKQKIKPYCLREKLMSLLSHTDFDIANVGKEKTAIFVIAREDNNVINVIANILIEQIFSLVMFEKVKFNFVLDNLETIPYITSLNSMIDMRSDNMKIYMATRDLNIIKDVYGKPNLFANVDKIIQTPVDGMGAIVKENKSLELPENNYKPEYFDIKEFLANYSN